MSSRDEAVTQAEFARRNGWAKSYVTQLKREGRLVLDEAGKVLAAASLAKIAETADPGHRAVAERHARARKPAAAVDAAQTAATAPAAASPAAAPPPNAASEAGEEAASPDYQAARARREEANAKLAEMEVAQRAGQLLETAAVVSLVADAAATFRSSLESRHPVLAAQLAVVSSADDVRQILIEADEILLHDLARQFARIGKGGQG